MIGISHNLRSVPTPVYSEDNISCFSKKHFIFYDRRRNFLGNLIPQWKKPIPWYISISCHEMDDNVFQDYKQTIHYKNRTHIRAIFSDCHVPRPWHHKMVRKIQTNNELTHEITGKITGSINTCEKFIARRQHLAESVWSSMQQTDARECRNCHTFDAMEIKAQQSRSGLVHKYSQKRGKTCIDCHKGIAPAFV